MNTQLFIKLLKNPLDIDPSELKGLEEVVVNFPYCQAAHILISKGAHESGSMLAAQKLKKAAIYTSDRANLKKIILLKEEILNTKIDNSSLSHGFAPETEPLVKNSNFDEIEQVNTTENLQLEKSTSFQEEPFREDLFKEIEENLKKLNELKRKHEESLQNQVPQTNKTVTPIFSETIKEEAGPIEQVEEKVTEPDNFQKKMDSLIYEEPFSEAKHYISSSRLFEELTPEEDGFTKEAEILSAYMDYVRNARSKYRKDKKADFDIIDKFIREDPMISPLHTRKINLDAHQEDLADKRLKSKLPISENFAKLMTKQGKNDKAIDIYQQLILKYPEKKAYFATQIENLKNQ